MKKTTRPDNPLVGVRDVFTVLPGADPVPIWVPSEFVFWYVSYAENVGLQVESCRCELFGSLTDDGKRMTVRMAVYDMDGDVQARENLFYWTKSSAPSWASEYLKAGR